MQGKHLTNITKMKQNIYVLSERRNQLGVNLTGSEGRTPEVTTLMVSKFYTLLIPNSNTVTFGNSGNNLAGVLCATDRNSWGEFLIILFRGVADLIGKRVMAAPEEVSIPTSTQPGGSLIQTKLIGQTSKPKLALGKLAPCCQDDEQKALDKIDESLATVHIHQTDRQPKGMGCAMEEGNA
jgi:hypothetical protein